jgi:hypothetical protein
MQALTARDLLDVWEAGDSQPLVQRALLLLSAAFPETPIEALAQLPVGQRDARLLAVREWLFGPQLISVAICPNCGERLQLTSSTRDLRASSSVNDPPALTIDRFTIQYRLPNSADLLALAGCETVEASRRVLLQRCVQSAQADGVDQSIEALPSSVIEAIASHMAQADPQADLQFDVRCPACDHRWLAAFDAASFTWAELDAWAQRTLREVHALALAYGWSEADILGLSATRRQAYLTLIGRA